MARAPDQIPMTFEEHCFKSRGRKSPFEHVKGVETVSLGSGGNENQSINEIPLREEKQPSTEGQKHAQPKQTSRIPKKRASAPRGHSGAQQRAKKDKEPTYSIGICPDAKNFILELIGEGKLEVFLKYVVAGLRDSPSLADEEDEKARITLQKLAYVTLGEFVLSAKKARPGSTYRQVLRFFFKWNGCDISTKTLEESVSMYELHEIVPNLFFCDHSVQSLVDIAPDIVELYKTDYGKELIKAWEEGRPLPEYPKKK
jgi:hypothetical protein